MKKIVLFAASLVSFGFAANAQVNSSAQQQVNLSLADAIEITFTGSGTATGDPVTMTFSTVTDYANGVESAAQQLQVRSNKDFKVQVKANAANFSYTGSASPAPSMPVSGILKLMVPSNNTGGTVASTFGTAYTSLTSTNADLITSATKGGNKTFEVQYKAEPGFNYPSGTYTVDVVYTATQL